ncbi:MAG: hypothetical protein IPK53_07125 [bacterium]|nr:hypothetical protein [bacterium]
MLRQACTLETIVVDDGYDETKLQGIRGDRLTSVMTNQGPPQKCEISVSAGARRKSLPSPMQMIFGMRINWQFKRERLMADGRSRLFWVTRQFTASEGKSDPRVKHIGKPFPQLFLWAAPSSDEQPPKK